MTLESQNILGTEELVLVATDESECAQDCSGPGGYGVTVGPARK